MKNYSDIKCLLDIIGKKLTKILALVYWYGGKISADPLLEIQFEFEGLNSVRVFCGSDGSTICWNNSDIEPFSMDECGELKIFNLSDSDMLWSDIVWKNVIDKTLERVYLVTSEIQESIFAIKFVFSDGYELVIANLGDELRIQRQLLIEIIEEENCQFVDINQIMDISEIKFT
jgi:hypothetical protein